MEYIIDSGLHCTGLDPHIYWSRTPIYWSWHYPCTGPTLTTLGTPCMHPAGTMATRMHVGGWVEYGPGAQYRAIHATTLRLGAIIGLKTV